MKNIKTLRKYEYKRLEMPVQRCMAAFQDRNIRDFSDQDILDWITDNQEYKKTRDDLRVIRRIMKQKQHIQKEFISAKHFRYVFPH